MASGSSTEESSVKLDPELDKDIPGQGHTQQGHKGLQEQGVFGKQQVVGRAENLLGKCSVLVL